MRLTLVHFGLQFSRPKFGSFRPDFALFHSVNFCTGSSLNPFFLKKSDCVYVYIYMVVKEKRLLQHYLYNAVS